MQNNEERLQQIKKGPAISPKDLQWLINRAEKAETYETILGAVANIDAIFVNGDGAERPFNEKEALVVIDDMVQPVWKDVCERTRNENKIRF